MEQNIQQSTPTLDLVKNEIQTFLLQHQNQEQNQSPQIKKLSVESSSSEQTILAQKLMQILENEEEAKSRAAQSPEKKAMSNSLVVREILSKMDVHSLLRFREVSRLWREEATLLLSSQGQEGFLCVKFKAFPQSNNYRHDNGETLEDFLEKSAQNPQMFIYSGFIFEGGYFQLDQSLEKFFSDFGPRIQHLNLSLEFLDVTKLGQILQELSPNLKSLILNPQKVWNQGSPPLKAEDLHLSLPKLKKLTLPKIRLNSSGDLISEILMLSCTPNLTSIEDPSLNHVNEIISAGKISMVKSLTWSFLFSTEQVTSLLTFIDAGPKLTSLTLRDFTHPRDSPTPHDTRIFPALLTLLNLGQNTLEKVTGLEILGQYFGVMNLRHLNVQISPLPNLTELHVSADKVVLVSAQQILPQNHDLSRYVPNLKTLHLKTDKSEIYPFISHLNAHQALQTLKISICAFKLTRYNVRQWVEQLGVHYPNITHLDISIRYKGEENIPECLKLIPRYFKQLEQLVLQFWVSKSSYDQQKSEWNLDEALTGFSKEECSTLKKKHECQNIETLDQIRKAPSILDLKKLTNLTFEVQFKGKVQPLWSHVAQLYAFQPMIKSQGLEVKVSGFYTRRIPLSVNELGPL